MFDGSFGHDSGGHGFGGHGFGGHRSEGHNCGGHHCGEHGFGGPAGMDAGPHRPMRRPAVATAAMLLDGPATAQQIVGRVSDKTEGALNPPVDVVELAIGVLAGRGVVTVDNGVATLTEFGRSLLAWRDITPESAQAYLSRAAKFSDVIAIRGELFEIGKLARTIMRRGTDQQKAALADARAKVLVAVREAKKSLYAALAAE